MKARTLFLIALGGICMSAYAAEPEAAEGTDSNLLSQTATTCGQCDCKSWEEFDKHKSLNSYYNKQCGTEKINLAKLISRGKLSPHTCIRQTPAPLDVKHERRSWDLGCGCSGRPALYLLDHFNPYLWKRVETDCLEIEVVCGPVPQYKLLSEDDDDSLMEEGEVSLMQGGQGGNRGGNGGGQQGNQGGGGGGGSGSGASSAKKEKEAYKGWSVRITTCEQTLPAISLYDFFYYYQVRCLKDQVCCEDCEPKN